MKTNNYSLEYIAVKIIS